MSMQNSASSSSGSSFPPQGRRYPKKPYRDWSGFSIDYDNLDGISKMDARQRSVLCHPLGLPLFSTLHGEDPAKLEYLSRTSQFYNHGAESTLFNDLLAKAVEQNWQQKKKKQGRTERPKYLAEALAEKILEKHAVRSFSSDGNARLVQHVREPQDGKNHYGRIDLRLTSSQQGKENKADHATPLAMIEVGRHDQLWWKKVDQSLKYLEMMENGHEEGLRYSQPILLAVLTMEGKGDGSNFNARLAVFLCSTRDAFEEYYRMSLLWHSRFNNLESASKGFGKFVRAMSDFSRWRKEENEPWEYEYLGPACCKIDMVDQNGHNVSKVLRCYDNRYRTEHRNSEIYEAYLGCKPAFAVTVPVEHDVDNDDYSQHSLWRSEGRELKVIVAPYWEGRHYATTPAEFVPIICEVEKLHKAGFVHGDIRAFNLVFGETHGWLIDFDFGGRQGQATTVYPQGYEEHLSDGGRFGGAGETIEMWHDWYALIGIIFRVHRLVKPEEEDPSNLGWFNLGWKAYKTETSWLCGDCNSGTKEVIDELKELMLDLSKQGWTMEPSYNFKRKLGDFQEAS